MISSADLSSSRAFQWEFNSHDTLKQFCMAGIQLFYYWLKIDGPCSSFTAQIAACGVFWGGLLFFFWWYLGTDFSMTWEPCWDFSENPISFLTAIYLFGSTVSSRSSAYTYKDRPCHWKDCISALPGQAWLSTGCLTTPEISLSTQWNLGNWFAATSVDCSQEPWKHIFFQKGGAWSLGTQLLMI